MKNGCAQLISFSKWSSHSVQFFSYVCSNFFNKWKIFLILSNCHIYDEFIIVWVCLRKIISFRSFFMTFYETLAIRGTFQRTFPSFFLVQLTLRQQRNWLAAVACIGSTRAVFQLGETMRIIERRFRFGVLVQQVCTCMYHLLFSVCVRIVQKHSEITARGRVTKKEIDARARARMRNNVGSVKHPRRAFLSFI